MAFFVHENLPKSIDTPHLRVVDRQGVEDGRPCISGMPLTLDANQLLSGLLECSDAKMRSVLMDAIEKAPIAPTDTAVAETILAALYSALGVTDKDIIAMMIRHVAQRTNAFAVLKIDEGYWMKMPSGTTPADITGPVSEMPGRLESIIVHMETHETSRHLAAPIRREIPNDEHSRALGTEEPHAMEFKPGEMTGRFTNFLFPMPAPWERAQ